MARPGWPERNKAARSFRQLRRFHHVINSDKVFGTHRDWNQSRRKSSLVRNGSKKLLVRVDARAAELEDPRLRLGTLDDASNRLRHIFHIRWLQSHQAAAEHRIDWEPAEKVENGGEKRIVRSEHNGRADEKCIAEGRPDRQFAFAALTDVP